MCTLKIEYLHCYVSDDAVRKFGRVGGFRSRNTTLYVHALKREGERERARERVSAVARADGQVSGRTGRFTRAPTDGERSVFWSGIVSPFTRDRIASDY